MAGMRGRRAPEARLPPPPSERRRRRRVYPGEPPATVAVTPYEAALGQSAETPALLSQRVACAPNGISVPRWSLSKPHLKGSVAEWGM
jgi:hypothetical protein